jgi:hypothetical protein
MHTYQFVPLALCVLLLIGLAEAAEPGSQAACQRADWLTLQEDK